LSLNLKFKATVAIILLVLTLSSLNFITYVHMTRSVATLSDMIDVTVIANNLKVMTGTMTEGLPTEIEDFALHPSKMKELKIQETFQRIEDELVKLEAQTREEQSLIQLHLLRNMFSSYEEGFGRIRNLVQHGEKFSPVFQEITSIKENTALISEAIQKHISNELSQQQTEKESLSQSIRQNGFLMIGLIILSALVTTGVFYRMIICQSIIEPLQTMKETMRRISTNAADIKLRVRSKSDDEIGSLAIFFNQMADTIQQNNEHLEEIVDERTRQLKEAHAMLVQSGKLSALGEMAGGIAHEINTPLAIISIKAEQLQDRVRKLKDGEHIGNREILAATEVISKTVQRISKVVSGLRSFARDGSKDPMSVIPVSALLRDALSLCAEKFANEGIKLEVNLPPSVVHQELSISCRETEIVQVLINLLNNSFDAIHGLPDPWIRVTVEDHWDFTSIHIVDAGTGISPDIRSKIMQPFFTTKDIGKGTGLGLSISQGIVESHSGKLYLDPNSTNTKFTMRLPSHRTVFSQALHDQIC
jgi:C4-dicarboxylate-specific signal transduction histidine kinase